MGTRTLRVPNQCHSRTAPPPRCTDPCQNRIWQDCGCSRPSRSSCSQRTGDIYGVSINRIAGRTGTHLTRSYLLNLTVSKVETFRDEFKLNAVVINSAHDGCSVENMKVKSKNFKNEEGLHFLGYLQWEVANHCHLTRNDAVKALYQQCPAK
jgi:hypothetical protein